MAKSPFLFGTILLIIGFPCGSAMTMTYYIFGTVGSTSEVTESLAIDIIQDAFDVWTCYTGIQFKRVLHSTEAKVFVVFGRNVHSAFAKGGVKSLCYIYEFSSAVESGFGVAAHSTLLHDREFPGNIHLHDEQVWTYGKRSLGGRSLFEVMVHEIGHVFGISHDDVSGDPHAVMTTGHRHFVPPDRFDLTPTDLNALRKTAFGKVLIRRGMLKMHCANKSWQRKMSERLSRVKRCGDVDHIFCRDSAKRGYCENEYEYTRIFCRSTCSFCECKDLATGCKRENCIKHHYSEYKFSYCRKTCGLCPTFVRPWVKFENTYFAKLRCIDELPSSQCVKAKEERMCTSFREVNIMRKFCRKTCGFCR